MKELPKGLLDDLGHRRLPVDCLVVNLLIKRLGQSDRHHRTFFRVLPRTTPLATLIGQTSWGGPDPKEALVAHNRETGKKAASAAGKVLADPTSTKAEKSAAASALAQTPGQHKSGSKGKK